MDWLIAEGRLSFPEGVTYQDGHLFDSVLKRDVVVSGTGCLVLEAIGTTGLPFRSLAQMLSSKFGLDLSQIASDLKPFLLGLNSRHLLNIDTPIWPYVRYLCHATIARLLGGRGVWLPMKRFALVSHGHTRVDRIIAAIPTLYWLLAGVMIGGITPQLMLFYPLPVVLMKVALISLSLVAALVVHEWGHMLAIRWSSAGRQASYLVRTPVRLFTVHEGGTVRSEAIIGLAGPALAVALGMMANAFLWSLDLEPTVLTLPFTLQIVCFLPGFGDADQMWGQLTASVKSWWRRLIANDP